MVAVKAMALLGAFGGAIYLFAEASVAEAPAQKEATDFMGTYAELGALGVVAVVLVFIVTKMLPDLHLKMVDQSKIFAENITVVVANFTNATAVSQKAYTETLEKITDRQHADLLEVSASIRTLSEQIARHVGVEYQVTLNPPREPRELKKSER